MKILISKLIIALLLIACLCAGAKNHVNLQPPAQRKMAPAFALRNSAGQTANASTYRGKVLLLNFWATECGGCRAEIPYFVDFEQAYGSKGLAVVGVSMDVMYENLKDAAEAWTRVKPFVQQHKVNYPILMGDDPVSKLYNINSMPATYLIDRKGRVAAAYIGVVVDKQDVESKIRALLQE
jgi:cytochrome c biogenesis protein CcmG/thiol:disulfide interchange protein DsbE